MKYTLTIISIVAVFFIFDAASAQVNQGAPAIVEDIGVDEKLGEKIPLNLRFANS